MSASPAMSIPLKPCCLFWPQAMSSFSGRGSSRPVCPFVGRYFRLALPNHPAFVVEVSYFDPSVAGDPEAALPQFRKVVEILGALSCAPPSAGPTPESS